MPFEAFVDADDLRRVMRNWVTGVTVVTSMYEGIHHGMTVNSFTSVSLTPPLVMVSLEQSSRTHDLVKKSGNFAVTILAGNQIEVSDCFAGRLETEDRFSGLKTETMVTGARLLSGGISFLDCKVVSTYDAGTHTLFIGEVLAARMNFHVDDLAEPLLYYDRAYRRLQK